MFKKVGKKETLSQEIVSQIEQAIRENEYKPGEKIPTEKEMCEIFDVSRTVIRESLQKLKAKGLIEIKKGSGIYVSEYAAENVTNSMNLFLEMNLDREYISYVIEVRKMIEPDLARKAALNREEDDLVSIKKTIEELEECDDMNFEKEGEIDRRFHLNIAEACNNPVVMLMLEPIYELMPKIRSLVYRDLDRAKSEAYDYHKEIYKKIKTQDAESAYKTMSRHLEIAEKHSKHILEKIE